MAGRRDYRSFRRRCRGASCRIDPSSQPLLACRWLADGPRMDANESERPGRGEAIARFLLTRSPLGVVVRYVASLRASVHAKLLGAFLLIALLLVAMTAMSLEAIPRVS